MSHAKRVSARTNDNRLISAPLFDYLITTSLQMIGRNQLNNFVGRNFTWQSDITRFLIGLLIVRMVCHFCEQLLVEMMTLQTIMGKFSYNLN